MERGGDDYWPPKNLSRSDHFLAGCLHNYQSSLAATLNAETRREGVRCGVYFTSMTLRSVALASPQTKEHVIIQGSYHFVIQMLYYRCYTELLSNDVDCQLTAAGISA